MVEECQTAGYKMTANILDNIEGARPERNRHSITVDDLMALAVALGVHPVDLLVPAGAQDDAPFDVTPTTRSSVRRARDWISGHGFLTEPANFGELVRLIQGMPTERAERVTTEWLRSHPST